MKKVLSLLLCSTLFASAVGFSACSKNDKTSIYSKEKLKSLTLPKEKNNYIDLNIYFDGSKDSNTPQIAKEERLIQKEELIGEAIMNELIKGPSVNSKLKPILPKESKLLSFSIKDGIAYVNLSNEAKTQLSPVREKVCLDSIVNSLCELPSVKKVKILIENKDDDSLGGNYDLSKPLSKGEPYVNKK